MGTRGTATLGSPRGASRRMNGQAEGSRWGCCWGSNAACWNHASARGREARRGPRRASAMKQMLGNLFGGGGAPRMDTKELKSEAAFGIDGVEEVVAVAGANGRLGSCIVRKLRDNGFKVKALVKNNADNLDKASKSLEIVAGFDITDSGTYRKVSGCHSLVISVGGTGGPDTDPADIDAAGVRSLVSFAEEELASVAEEVESTVILPFSAELPWQQLNDTIMGGKSSSDCFFRDQNNLVWTGILNYDGGGFCGIRSAELPQKDLSHYDGLTFRVLGDGQRYKISLRSGDNVESRPESSYQAHFDTVCGEWTTVSLPWASFVPFDQAVYKKDDPPLNPSSIRTVGLVLSRFGHNAMRPGTCKEGKFVLEVGSIKAFRMPRPQVVLISSASAERNQLIETDLQRQNEIPIVQMNPKSVLNKKYIGETAVRQSSLNYTVIRPTGLKDEIEGPQEPVEVTQGDISAGVILRDEVAEVVSMVLSSPLGLNATFELARRAPETSWPKDLDRDLFLQQQLLRLVSDDMRHTIGLPPFPPCDPDAAP